MDICKHRWEPREQSSAAPGTRHPATLLITLRPVSFPFCFDPLSPPPTPQIILQEIPDMIIFHLKSFSMLSLTVRF